MMIRLIVILWIFGILAGCSLTPRSWEAGDEPEAETDLTLFLTQMDPDKVGNVNLNGKEADQSDTPSFAQKLEVAVRPSNADKKVVNQLDVQLNEEASESVQRSGKKYINKKQPSADLVGSLDEEPQVSGDTEEDIVEEVTDDVADGVMVAAFNPNVDVVVIKDLTHSNLKVIEGLDAQGIRDFLSPLDEVLSWQVMFLSADVLQEGSHLLNLVLNEEIIQNRNVITPDTQSYEDIFVETITHNTRSVCRGCGKRKERPLGALNSFLQSDSANVFLRPEADLAVVIITDNDENRYNRKGQMTTSEHIMAVMNSRYPNKAIRGYSLTILDDECRKDVRYRTTFAKEGKYAPVVTEFSDRTQGGSFSLCTLSYGEVAEEIVSDQQNQS